jgi:hypothetical protein
VTSTAFARRTSPMSDWKVKHFPDNPPINGKNANKKNTQI